MAKQLKWRPLFSYIAVADLPSHVMYAQQKRKRHRRATVSDDIATHLHTYTYITHTCTLETEIQRKSVEQLSVGAVVATNVDVCANHR